MLLMTAMAVAAAAVCCTASGIWRPLSDVQRISLQPWANRKTIAARAAPPAPGTD
jgi:hypothetical protein